MRRPSPREARTRASGLQRNIALGATVVAAAIACLGGAARSVASTITTTPCPPPTGRLFCVTVEDTDNVSPTGVVTSGANQVNVIAYLSYTITITSYDGRTLTNGSQTFSPQDIVGGAAVASTIAYVPSSSAPFCSLVAGSTRIVRCTIGNLAAGATFGPFTLVYRTSTTVAATATRTRVDTTFNEKVSDAPPRDPVPDTDVLYVLTGYEPHGDFSQSFAPPGSPVSMGTHPSDTQYATFAFTNPTGAGGFLSSLTEFSDIDLSLCAPGVSCFGQRVRTDVRGAETGAFSPTNLFQITITISLDIVPTGNPDRFVVSHRFDDGTFEIVTARCGSDPPSAADTTPCAIFTKDNRQRLLVVRIYAWRNGDWWVG